MEKPKVLTATQAIAEAEEAFAEEWKPGRVLECVQPFVEQPTQCPRHSDRQCNGAAAEPHLCPYNAEINGDDETTTCTCCAECERECADDV